MASLVARVTALAQAVAADIKALVATDATKAGKGANSDITSLSGLTTPLSLGQGGTGANDGATGIANLIGTPFLNAPTTRPTLRLDFVNRTHLDPRIVWARASAGTCYGADGFLQLIAANQPRFDHDPITRKRLGVLIEESRANMIPFSQDFAAGGWSTYNSLLVPAAGLAPDGTYTATKAIENTVNTGHYWEQTPTINAGYTYTRTIFAKAAEKTRIRFENYSKPTTSRYVHFSFDLVAGTFFSVDAGGGATHSYSAQQLPNGWWRITHTFMLGGSDTSMYCRNNLISSSTVSSSYAGDGQSGVLIWGHQMEVGFNASSYMPTPMTWSARASTGTYFDKTGKLVIAASGVARQGYAFDGQRWISRGLVAEAAATNLLLYSEHLDNTVWKGNYLGVTANAAVAPDGNTTAEKLVEDTSANIHYMTQSATASAKLSTSHAFSFYAKAAGRSTFYVRLRNQATPANNVFAYYDLAAGTVTSKGVGGEATTVMAGIENAGGGWFRCWVAGAPEPTTASTTAEAVIVLLNAGAASYTGDGASGIYAWGGQLEAGALPTSYIPTADTTVTRVADTVASAATLREADYPWMPTGAWYNPYEGSMFASGDLGQQNAYLWELTDGTTFNRIISRGNGSTGIVGFQLVNGVVWSAGTKSVPVPLALGAVRLTAQAWDRSSLTVVDQGFPGTSNNTQQPTQCNQIRLGHSISGTVTSWLNGHLRQLHYYPQRLTGAELQGIAA